MKESSVVFENGKEVFLDLAVTFEEKQKGLMFVDFLPDNKGMIFIFDDEDKRSFWMKNTLIPLDIIFIDENYLITNILTALPCEKDPCELFQGKAKYVVEVNAGFCEKNNITKGQSVRLNLLK
jgi:uncharacterized protein